MRPPLSVVVMPFAFSLLACLLAVNWWTVLDFDMPWRAVAPSLGMLMAAYGLLIGMDMLRMWWTRR